MKLSSLHKVYMLGIGGIGMSAIARFLHQNGCSVSGYDRMESQMTKELCQEGIDVHYDFNPELIGEPELVIITPAIPQDNPLFQEIQHRNIPVKKRAEVLGMISRDYNTIAVAGTHGKTTTSAMIAHLLRSASIDCSAFVGGIMKNYNSNFLFGKDEWVVMEADEYDRSFLWLEPDVLVITSMDPDHLDIYGSGDEMNKTYGELAARVKENGKLILNESLRSFAQQFKLDALFYGLDGESIHSEDSEFSGTVIKFSYVSGSEEIRDMEMHFPGRHNLENAIAAISAVSIAGGAESGIREGISSFKGIKRRFDIQYIDQNLAYIDDYAHHPEEIRALISAVQEMFPGWKVSVIFQPHLYSRTRDFADGFADALSMADRVVLLDIYPAREKPIPGINSQLIFDKITAGEKYLSSIDIIAEEVKTWPRKDHVILSLGAGDIDRCVSTIREAVVA